MRLLTTAAVAAGMVLGAGAASAAQYTVFGSGGGQADPYTSQGDVTFPDYDGRLGRLAGASFSVDLSFNAPIYYRTPTATAGRTTVNTTFEVDYFGLSPFRVTSVIPIPATFVDAGNGLVTAVLNARTTLTGLFPDAALAQLSDGIPGDFLRFSAVPTYGGFIPIDGISSYSLTASPTITYSDVSLPEPTTLALFSAGAAGLAFVRRRRQVTVM